MAEANDFIIEVHLRDGDWIVSDQITGCYGTGKVVLHALEDYKDHLTHWHLSIATWDGKLAPHLEAKKSKTAGWFRGMIPEEQIAPVDLKAFAETLRASHERYIIQAQTSYYSAMQLLARSEQIYVDYAAGLGKDDLTEAEKKQALLNYILEQNEGPPNHQEL